MCRHFYLKQFRDPILDRKMKELNDRQIQRKKEQAEAIKRQILEKKQQQAAVK